MEFFTILSTMSSHIKVGFGSPKPKLIYIDDDIKLMLASNSHNDFEECDIPMVQGIVKALGFSFFCTNDRVIITLKC